MKRRITALGLGALALVGLLAAACSGDTTVNTQPGGEGISVTGSGSVSVEPDIGVLNLGVEVTEDTVAQARGGAAEALGAIRQSLADNGVEEKDITTRFLNIYPQYDYSEDRSQPEIVGFTASNQIEVKIREIDRTSEILDQAIDAGGDALRLNGIGFQVDDPEPHLEEARRLAVENARAKAEQLADLAGVSLGDARTITESTGGITPRFEAVPAAADTGVGGGATPISPGETEIVVNVSIVYDTK